MVGTVLVVTEQSDVTADHVVRELTERGTRVLRFDTAEFPQRLIATARLDHQQTGLLRTGYRRVDLSEVHSVYYRRPSIYQPHPELTEAEAAWAVQEARFGFGGLLAALPNWLNHPANIATAEYKPVQFAAARAAGLRIPPTLLSNDPIAVRDFARQVGPIIYKPLAGSEYSPEAGQNFFHTQPIEGTQLDDISIGITSCLFQQQVPNDYEVRVAAVDGRCFAARIDADPDHVRTTGRADGRMDWRSGGSSDGGSKDDSLRYTMISVPEPVMRQIRTMLRTLRLRFSALDFIVTPEGQWIWLEVHPNGQWSWIADLTPRIAGAVADALEGRSVP